MASANWRTTTDIIEQLKSSPYDFNFYKAVSLLEEDFYRKQQINISLSYNKYRHLDEFIQFKAQTSLSMPSADIINIDEQLNEDIPTYSKINIQTTFMSLAGTSGPLPNIYTEILMSLNRAHNHSLQQFLDIFHHRLISKLYQANRKNKITLDVRPPTHNNFSQMLYSLTGHFSASMLKFLPIPRKDLLFFTNLFAQKNRTASGLRTFLSEITQSNVTITQCIGKWFDIDSEDQTTLGKRQSVLGVNTIIGNRAWIQTAALQIKIGPMSRKKFLLLLPDSKSFELLLQTITFYTLGKVSSKLTLSIEKTSIKAAKLDSISPPKLGWTSWLSAQNSQSYTNEVELNH